MYYGARWYSPETGRFISEDPAGANQADPLMINRYVYCRNNPLIYTDPTGMFWQNLAGFAISQHLWKTYPREMAIITGIALGAMTGGAATAALGGVGWMSAGAAAAIGVGVGAVVSNYVTAFSMSVASGHTFEQSTNAGSRMVTQSDYTLTIISMGITYFAVNAVTADGAEKAAQGRNTTNGGGPTVDGVDLGYRPTEPNVPDTVDPQGLIGIESNIPTETAWKYTAEEIRALRADSAGKLAGINELCFGGLSAMYAPPSGVLSAVGSQFIHYTVNSGLSGTPIGAGSIVLGSVMIGAENWSNVSNAYSRAYNLIY